MGEQRSGVLSGCCPLLSKQVGRPVIAVQALSCGPVSATPRTAARQAALSPTNSRSSLKLTSTERRCHPATSSSAAPFSSCLQSFPILVHY